MNLLGFGEQALRLHIPVFPGAVLLAARGVPVPSGGFFAERLSQSHDCVR